MAKEEITQEELDTAVSHLLQANEIFTNRSHNRHFRIRIQDALSTALVASEQYKIELNKNQKSDHIYKLIEQLPRGVSAEIYNGELRLTGKTGARCTLYLANCIETLRTQIFNSVAYLLKANKDGEPGARVVSSVLGQMRGTELNEEQVKEIVEAAQQRLRKSSPPE